jgi:hypothetical protein
VSAPVCGACGALGERFAQAPLGVDSPGQALGGQHPLKRCLKRRATEED